MTLGIQAGDGAQALDLNQLFAARDGFSVLTSIGGACKVGKSGNSTLAVDSGEVLFDGEVVAVDTQTVAVPDNTASNPRKDVVFIDGDGSAQLSQGTPAPAKPAGETGRDTFQPAPNDFADIDAVVLAEVFVPAGATAVDAANISDRRVPSELAQGIDLPDDTAIGFGDNDDAEIRFDDSLGAWVVSFGGEEFQVLPDGTLRLDGQLETAGDADIGGDISFNGAFQPSDINADTVTSDAVDADVELSLPVFSDNSNAVAEDSQVWFNDGSGPNAAGVYFYDGGVVGPLATGAGSAPASLSGLTINTTKDFDGFRLEGLGHDEVDVPQTFDLTVDDFERPSLGDDYVGDTQDAEIQSSVALEGQRSLQINPSTTGTFFIGDTQSSPVQYGDSFRHFTELTDTDDQSFVILNVPDPSTDIGSTGIRIDVLPVIDEFQINGVLDGSIVSRATTTVDVSNHLNERLRVEGEITEGGTISARLFDASDTQLTSLSISLDDRLPESGGVQYRAKNTNTPPTIYFDGPFIDRRLGEETRERQRGATETSKLQTRGGVGAGPPSATPNQRRRTTHRHPVTTDAQQGQRYVDVMEVGGSPIAYVEGEFDGNGGSYRDRFQTATGSFTRINERLLVKTPTFADTDYTFAQGGSSHSTSVTGRPRELEVSHDGSGSDVFGGVGGDVITSIEELDSFRVTFDSLTFTQNNGNNNLTVGITDQPLDTNVAVNGNGIFFQAFGTSVRLGTVNSGATFSEGISASEDLSGGRTVAIEYDGQEVRVLLDGQSEADLLFSGTGDFQPILQLFDDGANSTGETATVEQITVSPLTEVLR